MPARTVTRTALSLALTLLTPLLALGQEAAPTPTTGKATEPSRDEAEGEADRMGRARMASVLEVLDGSPGELSERDFTPDLRQRRSADQLLGALRSLAETGGGYEALGVIDTAPGLITTVIRAKKTGERSRITVTFETRAPYRIDGLLVRPDLPSYKDWDEFTRAIKTFGGEASVAITQLFEDGSTEAVFTHGAPRPLNIAQHARLFVLHALMTAVDAGESDWLTTLQVRDQLKSLPPSETKRAPEGTPTPLTVFAHRMLAGNDMTAMDHLIDYLDKRTIQNLMRRRVSSMERNIPFLTSLEAYTLRLVVARAFRERWAEADDAGQFELLKDIRGLNVSDDVFASWVRPVGVSLIGWFASAAEINRLAIDLSVAAQHPSFVPVRGAIESLPPAPVDSTVWTRSRLIQSSEPGVFASTWILTHRDGRTFFLTGVFNNSEKAFAPARAGLLLLAATETLGRMPTRDREETTGDDPEGESPADGG